MFAQSAQSLRSEELCVGRHSRCADCTLRAGKKNLSGIAPLVRQACHPYLLRVLLFHIRGLRIIRAVVSKDTAR